MDNWRIGAGGRMYYPVQVPGALLSVGDPHVSQGDGEISGTALEASLNGLLRLTIRRDLTLRVPVLETATELLVHGFGDTLDDAMKAAALRTLAILESWFGVSRPDAYSFMSVAVDFAVTQVVDQRQGVYGIAAQTDQVIRNLARVTELCGGSLADVVSVRAFLTDWAEYAEFNVAYAAWFADRLPSRTCVGTTGLAVGARVEINWVCWRSDGWG